jgi:putative addiction module component (TIGR02574 family)
MTTEAQLVLKKALRLDAVERAELIEAIFRSFDKQGNDAVDTAWANEVEDRIDGYDKGRLKSRSAAVVMKRIGRR